MLTVFVQPASVVQAQQDVDLGTVPEAVDDYYWGNAPQNIGNNNIKQYGGSLTTELLVGIELADGDFSGGNPDDNGLLENDDDGGDNDRLSINIDRERGRANAKFFDEELNELEEDDITSDTIILGVSKTTRFGGNVKLYWNGAFRYTPPSSTRNDPKAIDTFTYYVTDGVHTSEEPATVRIQLLEESIQPRVDFATVEAGADGGTINVLRNDYPEEGTTYDSEVDTPNLIEPMLQICGYAAGFDDTVAAGAPSLTPDVGLTQIGTEIEGPNAAPSNGSASKLSISQAGVAKYTPPQDENGNDVTGVEVFTYWVTDGFRAEDECSQQTVAFTTLPAGTPVPEPSGNVGTPYVVYQDQTLLVPDEDPTTQKSITQVSGGGTFADYSINTNPIWQNDKLDKSYCPSSTPIAGDEEFIWLQDAIDDCGYSVNLRFMNLPSKGMIFREYPDAYPGWSATNEVDYDNYWETVTDRSFLRWAGNPSEMYGVAHPGLNGSAVISHTDILTGAFKYIPDRIEDRTEAPIQDSFEYVYLLENSSGDSVAFSTVGTVQIETRALDDAPEASDDSYSLNEPGTLEVKGYQDDTYDPAGDDLDPIMSNDNQKGGSELGTNILTPPGGDPTNAAECGLGMGQALASDPDGYENGGCSGFYTVVGSGSIASDGELIDTYASTDEETYWFWQKYPVADYEYATTLPTLATPDHSGPYNYADGTDIQDLDVTPAITGTGEFADGNVVMLPAPINPLRSDTATITIQVGAADDDADVDLGPKPIVEDDRYGFDTLQGFPAVYRGDILEVPSTEPFPNDAAKGHPSLLYNDTIDGETPAGPPNAAQLLLSDTPNKGVVTSLSGQGSFLYTPLKGATAGIDSFMYRAFDNNQYSDNEALVQILIQAPADAPFAGPDEYTLDPAIGEVRANGGDGEGDDVLLTNNDQPLGPDQTDYSAYTEYPSLFEPRYGTLSNTSDQGRFTYTPNTGYQGTEVWYYEYIFEDGENNTSSSGLTRVTIKVGNQPPVAEDMSYAFRSTSGSTMDTRAEDDEAAPEYILDSILTRLGADPLNPGDIRSAEVAPIVPVEGNTRMGGTVEVFSDGNFVYTLPDNKTVNDQFIDEFYYTLVDRDRLQSNTARVKIAVGGAYDYNTVDDHYLAPAGATSISVGQEAGLFNNGEDEIVPNVNEFGVEINAPLGVRIKDTARGSADIDTDEGGTAILQANGSFTYLAPDTVEELDVDCFDYQFVNWITDPDQIPEGQAGIEGSQESDMGRACIHFGDDTFRPMGGEVRYSTTKDTPVTVYEPGMLLFSRVLELNGSTNTWVENPVDKRAEKVQSITVSGGDQGGQIVLGTDEGEEAESVWDGSFIYTPATGFTGKEMFTFTFTYQDAEDATPVESNEGTLYMLVNEVGGIDISMAGQQEPYELPMVIIGENEDNTASTGSIEASMYGTGGQSYPWLGFNEPVEFTISPANVATFGTFTSTQTLNDLTYKNTATVSTTLGGTTAISVTAGPVATTDVSVTARAAWGATDSLTFDITSGAISIVLEADRTLVSVGNPVSVTATVDPVRVGDFVRFTSNDGQSFTSDPISDTATVAQAFTFDAEGTYEISSTLYAPSGVQLAESNTVTISVTEGLLPDAIEMNANPTTANIGPDDEYGTSIVSATLKRLGEDFVGTGEREDYPVTWSTMDNRGTLVETLLAAFTHSREVRSAMAQDVEVVAATEGEMPDGSTGTISNTVTVSFVYVDEDGNPLDEGSEYSNVESDPTQPMTLTLTDENGNERARIFMPAGTFGDDVGYVEIKLMKPTPVLSGSQRVIFVAFWFNVYSDEGELLNASYQSLGQGVKFYAVIYGDMDTFGNAFAQPVVLVSAVLYSYVGSGDMGMFESWMMERAAQVKNITESGVTLSQSGRQADIEVELDQTGAHAIIGQTNVPVYLPLIATSN
jgi:hypothetical protein